MDFSKLDEIFSVFSAIESGRLGVLFNILKSVLVIFIAYIVWHIIKRHIKSHVKKKNITGKKASKIHFTSAVLKYSICLIAFFFVLKANGVNVSSLMAGIGIVGIIVGFALQDLLKDFIMGVSLLWDRFFVVGDVVKYKDIIGQVKYFNIKITKIRDIHTNNVYTISNRNISEIEKVSEILNVKVPMSYEVPTKDARHIMHEIADRISALQIIKTVEFFGTEELAANCIYYLIRVHCSPEYRHKVNCICLGIIQDVYDESGIAIPLPQLDVHMK